MEVAPTRRATSPVTHGEGYNYAGAPTQLIGQYSKGIRTFENQSGGGGDDHIVSDGSMKSDGRVPAVLPVEASKGPRGLENQKRPPPGGVATVSLGNDTRTYHCSTAESQWRPSVDPGLVSASKDLPVAGVRPPAWELGVRRRNDVIVHPSHPVGGEATVSLNDGTGGETYVTGIKEAQLATALNPSAMESAKALEVAGKRVEPKWLGAVARQTRDPGAETQTMLPVPSTHPHARHQHQYQQQQGYAGERQQDLSSSTSSSSSPPRSPLKSGMGRGHFSPAPETGQDAVGAHSSAFLQGGTTQHQQQQHLAAVPLRTSRDSSIATLLGGEEQGGGGVRQVLSPRDRKVTLDGVCKQVGGWVGGGYSGIDEVNARMGISQRRG